MLFRRLLFLLMMTIMLLGLSAGSTALAQDGGTPTPDEEVGDGEYEDLQPGDYGGLISTQGGARRYLLHVPTGYDTATPHPLVISFHGFTSNPLEHAERSNLSVKADEEGFIVAYPEGQREPAGWFTQTEPIENGWLDDVQFTRDLVASLQERLNVDPARIYVTGFSNGGGMVHRIACDMADVFAAGAPVAGPTLLGDPCDPGRPFPMFAIHGRLDGNAPYEGYYTLIQAIPDWAAEWAARNGCDAEPAVETIGDEITIEEWENCDEGAQVILRTYENNGHVYPDEAPDLIWEFFEAHTLLMENE
jgi:polyhydroxybutyrate depolymerase